MKKRLRSKSALRLAVWLSWAICAGSTPALADDSVRIETLKTHSRIVVQVDESVTSEWKPSASGFELFLKGVGLTDLGAPLGDEERWASRLARPKDTRIASLTLVEVAGGVKIAGKWKFPSGASALANPKMESFDYRDKTPAALIVDLWLKGGPTVAEVSTARRQADKVIAIRNAEKEARERASRKLASEKARAETEDVGRFCRLPYSEATDVFLPLYPMHESVDFSRWMSLTTPDQRFYYYEPKAGEKDAQYVRLALELYRQGKPALVLRTLDFFAQEHPKSAYRTEMRFLRANALIKLNMARQAEEQLVQLMSDAQASPVALHSAMYIAARRATQKSHLAALEPFLWLISHHSDHRLAWLFHLGAAEAFYGMKQTERAAKEYQWVIEHAPERHNKAEAAVRMGDLYMERFQYEQSLASYFQGLNYFGREAEDFPSIFLNRGEALYGLGQLDRAKTAFEEFLKRYPSHPAGWRATYRLGEIVARASETGTAVARESEESRKWFVETINRYPFGAGATLARFQLLPCGDHGGLSFEGAQKFFDGDAEKFDGKGEVVMSRYSEFKGLARIRSMISWKRDDLAVAAALRETLSHRTSETRTELMATLRILYRRQIRELLAAGKKYEAIAFFQEKSTYLPKEDRYAEPEYLLKLSQAASDLGMGKLGEELAAQYREATTQKSDRAVASAETSTDPSRLLRIAEQNYSEAKALWVSSGMGSEKAIREKLAQVNEESPHSFEREVILGLMDHKAGKHAQALAHAAKAQLLRPADQAGPEDLRLDSWLTQLETEAGDPKLALEMSRRLEARLGKAPSKNSSQTLTVLGVPEVTTTEHLLLVQAGLLDRLQKWGDAARAYGRAIDEGFGGSQARFGYARALLRTGTIDSREKGLGILKEMAQAKPNAKESDLWKRLAREALANETLANVQREKKNPENQAKEGLK